MLAALLREPGVEEHLELRSARVGFLALHGGNQDRGTERIAAAAAASAGASFYGVVQPSTLRWHLPSWRYDPADSPALSEMLAHVDVVISVHGYGRDSFWFDYVPVRPDRPLPPDGYLGPRRVLVGGGNRVLAATVAEALQAALVGVDVVDDLDAIPIGVRGLDARNPVNLPRGGGAQIELPPGVRGLLPGVPDRSAVVAAALAGVAATLINA